MKMFSFALAALLACSCVAEDCPAPLKKALIAPRLDAKTLARLKDNGYDGVELRDRTATIEEARAARALAEANSVRIHSFMGGWFKFNSPEDHASEIALATHCIRLAAAYGADVMLIVPYRVVDGNVKGPCPADYKPEFDPASLTMTKCVAGDNAPYAAYIAEQNKATEAAKRAIRELLPVATECGVVLAIENVGGHWFWATPAFSRALVKHFASPYVKFYLDLGNHIMYCPPEEWLAVMPEEVVRLHVKDHTALPNGMKKEAPLGLGSIDYKAIRRAISRYGFNGWVSIETNKRSDAEHAAFMDDFFKGNVPSKGYQFGRR